MVNSTTSKRTCLTENKLNINDVVQDRTKIPPFVTLRLGWKYQCDTLGGGFVMHCDGIKISNPG